MAADAALTQRADLLVVGLGALGSATAMHAAKRGARVIGIERFGFGHDLGSSSGSTRIIRKAYFESPQYVPLLARAYELWRELERESATPLLDLCGTLMIGRADSATIRGMTESAQRFGLELTSLSADEIRARYPMLRVRDDEVGLLERDAGLVQCERAVAAQTQCARAYGAQVFDNTPMLGFERHGDGFVVHTPSSVLHAAQLAICTGAWFAKSAANDGLPLQITRNVQYWFQAHADLSDKRLPTFFFDRVGLTHPLYGFPDLGDGVKVAFHGSDETVDPDALVRTVSDDEIARMREALRETLPAAASGSLVRAKACMYDMTPDEHFVIGRVSNGAIVAGGFSGHGFKFAPAIGEIVTQLALDGATPHEIAFLSPHRFSPQRTA